ncbi:amino acid adenylation domain-containing protein, partial [Gemmiger sp.]
RIPDAPAAGDEHQTYTWAQLQDTARRVGSFIAAKTEPRRPVAFYLEKSVPVFAAMLGTVYAGCCYCLPDTRQPAARTLQVLNTLNPAFLVTDRDHADAAAALGYTGEIVLLDDLLAAEIDPPRLAARRAQAVDVDPLYINFTSGSTGVPKGVTVCHRSVLDFIPQFATIFGIGENDILGNQAPFDFDVSVKDLYTALYTGAKVQIIPRAYFSQPTKLMDYLADNGVTVLVWAVSAMCFVSIMNGFGYRVPSAVRLVLFSGEVLPVKHLIKWKTALPQARFVNLYGPTEITCNCTYYILPDRDFTADETLPIGRAFPNEKVFLLDENDALVTAPGQEGELCVSGTALALGYYADPARTAQSFTQNPLNHNWYERIYRTGDLARYDEAGELYYIGRKDFQIKHMGHRVELGEIEAAAMRCDDVSRACCIFDAEKQRLHLFYTGTCEKAALLAALKAVLPPFMQPNTAQQLDELPMNKNGKIDRTALAALTKKGAHK